MSKRRKAGEIVKRTAGSGFVGSAEPELIKVPSGKAFEFCWKLDESGKWVDNPGGEAEYCMLRCGDDECREFANVEVASGEFKGQWLCHISECEMVDHDSSGEETGKDTPV